MAYGNPIPSPEAVTLHSRVTDEPYDVFIGLPPVATDDGTIRVHEIPLQPYVVPVDTFVLREIRLGSRPLVHEDNVNVLVMHGGQGDRRWVPAEPRLRAMGVTILHMAEDFESEHPYMPIDVLYICKNGLSARTAKVMPRTPRVFMKNGSATGAGIRTIQGRVHADMFVNSPDEVHYLPWLQMRRSRPQGGSQ